jgi:hypothetical protein
MQVCRFLLQSNSPNTILVLIIVQFTVLKSSIAFPIDTLTVDIMVTVLINNSRIFLKLSLPDIYIYMCVCVCVCIYMGCCV